jgi:hypothetical protein
MLGFIKRNSEESRRKRERDKVINWLFSRPAPLAPTNLQKILAASPRPESKSIISETDYATE